MALPRAIQVNGRWAVDPGNGEAPVYCASQAIANQLVALITAGGSVELTMNVLFGGALPSPSEVTKVKKV
jgi:hypothetical protein